MVGVFVPLFLFLSKRIAISSFVADFGFPDHLL